MMNTIYLYQKFVYLLYILFIDSSMIVPQSDMCHEIGER